MTLQKMLFDTSNFMTVFPKMTWKKICSGKKMLKL